MSELTDTQLYPVPPVRSAPNADRAWQQQLSSARAEDLLSAADRDLAWQDTLTRYWPLVMLAAPSLVLAVILGWVSRP